MEVADLNAVALAAMRLQNGYAYAVDTRAWDYFQTLFTDDVAAFYPHRTFQGMSDWLSDFVPFHDRCEWTVHSMTNHVVGTDPDGIWATCYGYVEWVHRDNNPGFLNRSTVLYRDRLQVKDGTWRIVRRKLDILKRQPSTPLPADVSLPHSVRGLADVS